MHKRVHEEGRQQVRQPLGYTFQYSKIRLPVNKSVERRITYYFHYVYSLYCNFNLVQERKIYSFFGGGLFFSCVLVLQTSDLISLMRCCCCWIIIYDVILCKHGMIVVD